MMQIANHISIEDLRKKLENFWNLSGEKIRMIDKEFDPGQGAPVFTVAVTNRECSCGASSNFLLFQHVIMMTSCARTKARLWRTELS